MLFFLVTTGKDRETSDGGENCSGFKTVLKDLPRNAVQSDCFYLMYVCNVSTKDIF